METNSTTYRCAAIRDEITSMVAGPEFTAEKGEFTGVSGALQERKGKTHEQAWGMITGKIVEILPDYITEGLVHCSLEEIAKQEDCRTTAASGKRTTLKITPGNNFPEVPFNTFYPYLDFIVRSGPVDLFHHRTRFKVAGSMTLKNVTIEFAETGIDRLYGSVQVAMAISLCKGTYPVHLYSIKRPITIA